MAKCINVKYDGKPLYDIVIEKTFDRLSDEFNKLGVTGRKLCIVSDSNVARLYADDVAKAIKLSKEQAIAYDNKASCDGATSAMNKKVLLLMAIQKELNIKFPLDEVVQIKDTKKLTSVVYRQLNGKMAD